MHFAWRISEFRIGRILLAAAAGISVAGVFSLGHSAFGANPSSEMTTATWQKAIAQPVTKGLARGCYQTSYPSRQWHATTCKVAPEVPLEPAPVSTPANATVGDGTDYSAEAAGTISSATGSFDDVSPTITETGQVDDQGAQIANTFSLQLNTQFFSNSPACSGSGDPSNCRGWQQFAYESAPYNEVFMQYWLINYDATCPSGWYSYSSDCYTNSQASTYPGSALTAADLATTQLTGSASAGGNDEVNLSFGGEATLVINADSAVGLASNWNTAEFDVFGDGDGDQANFGANTTLEAQTTLSDSSVSAPTCVNKGFTAETNNLSLTNTPTIGTQGLPTIRSEQTNASPTTPSCAAGSGSKTATTVSTSLSGGGSSGAAISVPTGTAVTDQATLSGTNASEATGTVTYNVYSDSHCSDLVSGGTSEPITTPGRLPASAPVILDNAGTYYWQASYSGDTYNSSSTSSCGSEFETVEASATTSVLVPANGASLSGTAATLDASASNATSVEFWLFGGSYGYTGKMIGTATSTAYGWVYSWNTTTVPNGSYALLSEAFNASASAFSAGVSITVNNSPPPTTSVLVPANGASLSGTAATLDASASNATSVEFWLFGGSYGYTGKMIGTATSTAYGWVYSWNTTTVPNGSYALLSEAFNASASAFSAGVSITVKN